MEQGSHAVAADELLVVEALMRSTTESTNAVKNHASWLTVMDTKRVLTAIDHDADEVYLVDVARMFSITYRNTVVWLRPADNRKFIPCGEFDIKNMRRRVAENHALSRS